jgi:hypothetical protein
MSGSHREEDICDAYRPGAIMFLANSMMVTDFEKVIPKVYEY